MAQSNTALSVPRARIVSYAAPCLQPAFIPKSRPKGAKALGVAFEKALARALPKATRGQWFQYEDQHGPGWCQTDLLLESARRVVVIEAKLTNFEAAVEQLSDLYLPVLRAAWPEKEVFGIVALRHLSAVPRHVPVHDRLSVAIVAAERNDGAGDAQFPIFHWLGKGPVG